MGRHDVLDSCCWWVEAKGHLSWFVELHVYLSWDDVKDYRPVYIKEKKYKR